MRHEITTDDLRIMTRYVIQGSDDGISWAQVGHAYCEADSACDDAKRLAGLYRTLRVVDRTRQASVSVLLTVAEPRQRAHEHARWALNRRLAS